MPRPTLRALLALFLLAPAACLDGDQTSTTDQAVIGGSPTPQGEYPAVGALWSDMFAGASCTGTLIRPDVVLTAAHCVEEAFLGSEIPGFTLANDTLSSPPVVVAGLRYVQHPQFDINVDPGAGVAQFYDIGLLWLAQPITSTDPMLIATPAEANAGLVDGLDLQLVGYGRTSNETNDFGIKYDAIADLVDFNESELQISPGGGAPQNCHGDSGGPAIVDFGAGQRVIGVVSRSAAAKNDCDDGGIDTRPDYYLQWIEDEINAACEGGACPDAGVPDAMPAPDAGSPDAGDPGAEGDDSGCCSTGKGGGEAGALLLGALVLGSLRRRRPR
jgi:MYXO-CTERM domain-containing protein